MGKSYKPWRKKCSVQPVIADRFDGCAQAQDLLGKCEDQALPGYDHHAGVPAAGHHDLRIAGRARGSATTSWASAPPAPTCVTARSRRPGQPLPGSPFKSSRPVARERVAASGRSGRPISRSSLAGVRACFVSRPGHVPLAGHRRSRPRCADARDLRRPHLAAHRRLRGPHLYDSRRSRRADQRLLRHHLDRRYHQCHHHDPGQHPACCFC